MLTYKEFEPSEPLSEFIRCFWILEREYDEETPCENVLPDSYIELIFNFGNQYFVKEKGDLPFAFMIGLLKRPLPLYADGRVKLLCIRFYPWGPLSLFDVGIRETVNSAFDLGLSASLIEKLGRHIENRNYEKAVEKLTNFVLQIYIRTNFDKDTVDSASQILYREKGEVRIEELAKMCNVTPRTLQRNFSDKLGVPPKSYASNVRFDKAKKKLSRDPKIDLTELAYDCGYYDQAHFIKEFKVYCGRKPSDFAKDILRMSKMFTDKKNVVFLQSEFDDPS